MIKKKGRGGARPNAGRKRVINNLTWIDIGRMCERLQGQDAEDAALLKYEQLDRTKKIREAQKLIVKRRITSQPEIDEIWAMAGIEINKPGARVVSLKPRRVATREQIIARVSDACFKIGRRRITPRQVRESWYRYRALLDEAGLIAEQTPE
jgi:hypothetical protein